MNSNHHSIAIVPPFPGLCHFPEGRGFKQWTGDDSKALMKVRTLNYIFVSNLGLIITEGLFTRHRWPRPFANGPGTQCLAGLLLPGSP